MQQILDAAFRDPLNQAFSLAILALAGAAVVGAFARGGPLARLAQPAPGLLTALGVLGTFVGILLGLLDFDASDISRSVPSLLDGMKTAFVTSVFGMGSGIAVKLVAEVFAPRGVGDEAGGAKGVEDVLLALEGLRQESARTRQDLAGSLDRVRAALTGDNESSLVTQLQRLRTDVADEIKASRKANEEGIGAIAEEIRKVAATLSESASKAFVEALERTIRDFNQRIAEQFGENFKQLNVAVGRLLEWQDEYRRQMAANAEALREGAAGIQAARTGLEAIGTQAGALVQSATAMRGLLEGLDGTRAELDARLRAFRDMATAAASAMPTIQAKLEELTSGFSREVAAASQRVSQVAEGLRAAVEAQEHHLRAASTGFAEAVGAASAKAGEAAAAASRGVQSALEAVSADAKAMQGEQAKLLGELSQGYARLREDAAGIGADMRSGVKEAGEALRASLAEAAADLQRACAENVRTVGQQLQRTADEEFRRIAAGLDGQVKQLDEALRQELERALSALGSQLASLSDHFVRDYTPLTHRLRDLVAVAQRVQA